MIIKVSLVFDNLIIELCIILEERFAEAIVEEKQLMTSGGLLRVTTSGDLMKVMTSVGLSTLLMHHIFIYTICRIL
jgi:hypothetical protein